YSLVAKAFRVFNIKRQEREETCQVTFNEDDEAISKSSTEDDEINFNENRSFSNDEFIVRKSKVSQSSGKDGYFPYIPAYDPFSINNITIPNYDTPTEYPNLQDSPDEALKFTIADDHSVLCESDHYESADNLERVEVQDFIINEPISDVEPSPTIISSSAEVAHNPLAPQDRWSREKHIDLVNITGEPLAGTLVPMPHGKTIIGTKWNFKNKMDENGVVIKNKARLLTQRFGHEERIDYDETFAPIARLESIRIFLAYAAYMDFMPIENFAPLPSKETVKPALATLVLVDENNTSLSSTDLVNSSPLKMRYFSLIWRVLMVYIVKYLGGKEIEYLLHKILIIKHLLREAYIDDNLKIFKPHHISATSFKTPFESEVPLTAHMCKVAKLSPEPIKSMILPSRELNTDDIANKSLSGTIVQPVTQSKAKIDKKSRKKKNLASSKPMTLKIVRESYLSPQVVDTHPAEEPVTTADATHGIDASESTEELGNQPEPADVRKVHENIIEVNKDYDMDTGSGIQSLGYVQLDEFGGADANLDADESPFDMEFSISDQVMQTADSDLESMPGDEIGSLSGFEADESDSDDHKSKHKEELLKTDETAADNVLDDSLTANVEDPKSLLAMQVADKLEDSMPRMIIKDSVKQALPKFDKRVKKTLKAQVPEIILKSLNNSFNLFNRKDCNRFVSLQKTLAKTINIKVGTYVLHSVRKETKVVSKVLKYCVKQLDKDEVNLCELVNLIRDLVILLDSTSASTKAAPEGEKMSTQENIDSEIIVPALAQGEQQPNNTTPEPATAEEAKADAQGEQSSEEAPPISTALVIQSS
nr:retrovirus-related Pol polyprotein from transposon TNT 1-94 [Tanacetum cinerariifolium]